MKDTSHILWMDQDQMARAAYLAGLDKLEQVRIDTISVMERDGSTRVLTLAEARMYAEWAKEGVEPWDIYNHQARLWNAVLAAYWQYSIDVSQQEEQEFGNPPQEIPYYLERSAHSTTIRHRTIPAFALTYDLTSNVWTYQCDKMVWDVWNPRGDRTANVSPFRMWDTIAYIDRRNRDGWQGYSFR